MLRFGPTLRQPDRRSCGAACVVVATLVTDPGTPPPADFGAAVLATHHRLTGARDAAGRRQLPWPRALGTPPWAVARALGQITGLRYRARPARWGRTAAYDVVLLSAAHGPVALYVGSRWLPRHVTLVLGVAEGPGEGLLCYDPASGRQVTVSRADFARSRLRLGGWRVPWLVVVPHPASP